MICVTAMAMIFPLTNEESGNYTGRTEVIFNFLSK